VIRLKSRHEIDLMREAGRLVAEAHQIIRDSVQPGVTTGEIDRRVEQLFEERGAHPLFKGYPGKVPYPAVTCISVNDEVVHGIPGDRVLQPGDIVSVDTGCRVNGWCGDSAWTYPVGDVDPEKRKLLDIGEANLMLAISLVGKKKKWSEVAREMQKHVEQSGFSVVDMFVGHGIGQEMHESPQVPGFVNSQVLKEDFELKPGLVLAIEPMVNAGKKLVVISKSDHWTVRTRDGKPSVHFEHTVAITDEGPLILTAL
jgi:methionyl aminopeptidase